MMSYPPGSAQERAGRPPGGGPFATAFSRSMLVAGIAVMGFGAAGLIQNSSRTHPDQWIRWFVGSLIAHDLIVAPLVLVAGVAVSRLFRGPVKAWVQAGLISSAIVILTVYPFVRGYGRRPDNPSILPGNYARGLWVVVGTIWIVALVGAVVSGARDRRRQ